MIFIYVVSFLISTVILLIYCSVRSSEERNKDKENTTYSNLFVFTLSFIVSLMIQYFLFYNSSKAPNENGIFYKLIRGGGKSINKGEFDPYAGLIDEIDTGEVPF